VANDPENVPIVEDVSIDSLEKRIARARADEAARIVKDRGETRDPQNIGLQIISTMVGYPLGGILVGVLLDNLLGTLPWITIVLMFLAFAGACLHVVRMNRKKA
jgi:ATP synthase protein I